MLRASESKRRADLRAIMSREELDGFLATDPINVSYLTGFNGDDSFLLLGSQEQVLLSDTRFEEQIAEECPEIDALIRHSGQTSLQLVREAIGNGVLGQAKKLRVGIEASTMTVAFYRALTEAFPEIEFVPRDSDIESLREIKDEGEIAAIRQAIDTSIKAYRSLRGAMSSEQTEADLRDELEYLFRKHGGDDVSFPSIIAYDARAALPHAIPTRGQRLADASMVLIDWGAKQNRYVGDLTRAFLTPRGEADAVFRKKFKEVFEIVQEAHDAAISKMSPGVSCQEIDRVARDTIKHAGFGDYFGHGLGHGIGRVVHDYGGLSPRAHGQLRPGMVLTVEPGIYLPGWGGIRLEDDVLVTETGVEILSSDLGATD
ncbi:MAG: Xaa-Pro peptidase family protein [Planctomycetia bacterium]|nr:Xaa-Pro peptidase family protein [Planctomycetia bacterium]